jgi:hypothetical protein
MKTLAVNLVLMRELIATSATKDAIAHQFAFDLIPPHEQRTESAIACPLPVVSSWESTLMKLETLGVIQGVAAYWLAVVLGCSWSHAVPVALLVCLVLGMAELKVSRLVQDGSKAAGGKS